MSLASTLFTSRISTSCIRRRLPTILAFHTSAPLAGGGPRPKKPKNRYGKGSQTKLRSSSRTRLAKDINTDSRFAKVSLREAAFYQRERDRRIARSPPTSPSRTTRDEKNPIRGRPRDELSAAPRRGLEGGRERAKSRDRPSLRHDAPRNDDRYESSRSEGRRDPPAGDRSIVDTLLDEEFDRTSTAAIGAKISSTKPSSLPQAFSSPPLLPGLASSMVDILGEGSTPTPIQALAMKHILLPSSWSDSQISETRAAWRQHLLASETGSGKSFAYMLPMLQYLKQTESMPLPSPVPRTPLPLHPRALILAPTHELSRQLSVFAKSLVHNAKLRVLCASRANVKNRGAASHGTDTSSEKRELTSTRSARRMKDLAGIVYDNEGDSGPEVVDEGGEMEAAQSRGVARDVDVLVGPPDKTLEMVRGWGWNKSADEEDSKFKRPFFPGRPEMGLGRVEYVVIDEADILFDPDFRESTLAILSDISAARGVPVPATPSESQRLAYPFHLILSSATIPASLASYLTAHHPSLVRLASPDLHRLPRTLRTEHVNVAGGASQRDSEIARRIRRVWAEDALRSGGATGVMRSKVLIFCNRSTRVQALGEYLSEKEIPNIALTKTSSARSIGSNRHLSGFLKPSAASPRAPPVLASPNAKEAKDSKSGPAPDVLITTSLLSRGLDFAPSVKHVFIADTPRNMVDFLHRAGRSGRAGQQGKVVVFGKLKGRGSAIVKEVRRKVGALAY